MKKVQGFKVIRKMISVTLTAMLFLSAQSLMAQSIPSMTTYADLLSVSSNSATMEGSVVDSGGSWVTTRGFCYKVADLTDPDTSNLKVNQTGLFTEEDYSMTASSLSPETYYAFRAYAINSTGVGYGYTENFFTYSLEPSAHPATFSASTLTITQIKLYFNAASTLTNADGYLIIQGQGASPVFVPQDGEAYYTGYTNGLETVVAIVNSTSQSSVTIGSLTPGTSYYYKIYPYNFDGTNAETYNYLTSGSPLATSASTVVKPTVNTKQTVANINVDTARVKGSITDAGGEDPNIIGIAYNLFSLSANPTAGSDSSKTKSGTFGVGDYSIKLKYLSAKSHYIARFYATNSAGTSYGSTVDFYTLANEPANYPSSFNATTVSTSQINLSFPSAGTTGADGFLILKKQGSLPASTPEDAIAYSVGSGVGSATVAAIISDTSTTSIAISSVVAGNKYYFTIYPFNWDGSNYQTYNYLTSGSAPFDSARTVVPPTVTSNTVNNIKETSASLNGSITSTGGENATEIGVAYKLYSLSGDPTIADDSSVITGNWGVGSNDIPFSGMTDGSRYKAAGFAKNSAGYSYGTTLDFYTLSNEPTAYPVNFIASTTSTTQIQLSFDSAGTITNADGYLVLQKQGGLPTGIPVDANVYSVGSPVGNGIVTAIINSTSITSTYVTSVSAGNVYYFRIIPFSWNGSDFQTYNYKTDGSAPSDSAQTVILPQVTTSSQITNVKEDSADVSGNITNTGGALITVRGICYDTLASPDITKSKVQASGTFGPGIFNMTLSGLSPERHYYARAFATNLAGTGYGATYDFYTLSQEPVRHANTFTAQAVSTTQINVNFEAAGNITNADGYLIIQRQGAMPTYMPEDQNSYSSGSPVGNGVVAAVIINPAATSATITSVSAGNVYYFILVPFNWDGNHSVTYNYRTSATVPSAMATSVVAPLVNTDPAITNTTTSSADVKGSIINSGGGIVNARGFAFDTANSNINILTADTVIEFGTFGPGSFTATLSGLMPSRQYYMRAFAINNADTGYGLVYDFYTIALEPGNHSTTFTAKTSSTTQIDLSFDKANTISNANGNIVVQKQGSVPSGAPVDGQSYIVGSPIGDGTVAAIVYNANDTTAYVTSVSAGNTYYFKLFPLNWNGTQSSTVNYLTSGVVPVASAMTIIDPTVTTVANAQNITSTGADLSGAITATGSQNASKRGICYQVYSSYSIPDTNSSKNFETGLFGSGPYTRSPNTLSPENRYQFRAYAINDAGVGYGSTFDFYTLSFEPGFHPAWFNAKTASTTQIDLSFTQADSIINADGYLVIQKQDAMPTGKPQDGNAYAVGNPIGDGIVVAIITNKNAGSTNITSVSAGNTYYYTIFPFNWNGINAQTYNYKTDGTILSDSATTISAPFVSTSSTFPDITNVSVTVEGIIQNTGGSQVTERGVCYFDYSPISDPTTADNTSSETGTFTTGTFTRNISGLKTATHYEARAYAINNAGTGYGQSYDFYTLAVMPGNYPSLFDAKTFSTTQIDLQFSPFKSIVDGKGYIIVQTQGSAWMGKPENARSYSVGASIGNGIVSAVVNDSNKVRVNITNLNAGTKYYFYIIPYNWDGSSSRTYYYRSVPTIPADSATTLSPCPIDASIVFSGNPVICHDDSLLLMTVDTSQGLSYLWTYNGSLISGADSGSLWAKKFGDYRVFISNSFCSKASSIFSLTHYPINLPKIYAEGVIEPCSSDSLKLYTNVYSFYEWSTEDTTREIWVKQSGDYTVTVMDKYGCIVTSEPYKVNASITQYPEICMVTVDTSTNRNLIIWERENTSLIDSYYIYKETTKSGEYIKIGALPYNALSVFIDTNSNPAVKADRYKISSLDTCGVESPVSPYHKTMHLTVNKGIGKENNLIWDHYEGFEFSSYNIYRGTKPDSLILIDSIQNNLTSYSDLNPPQGVVLFYQVSVVNPDSCYPAIIRATTTSGPFSQSISNLKDYSATSLAYLNASPLVQTVELDSGAVARFNLYTNVVNWDAVVSDPTWVKIFKNYKDNTIVAVATSENTDDYERSATITVSGQDVNDLVLTLIQNGKKSSIPEPKSKATLVKVFPNPFDNYTNIYYELNAEADVQAEVFDMVGKKLATLASEHQQPGVYNYKFTGSSGNRAEGFYFLKLTIDKKVHFVKIMQL